MVWVNQVEPSGEAATPSNPGVVRCGEGGHHADGGVEVSYALKNEPEDEPDLPIGGAGDCRGMSPAGIRKCFHDAGCWVETVDAAVKRRGEPHVSVLSTTASPGRGARELSVGDVVAPEAVVVEIGAPDVVAVRALRLLAVTPPAPRSFLGRSVVPVLDLSACRGWPPAPWTRL